MLLFGGFCLSWGGFIVRSFEQSTVWEILFLRSFFFLIALSHIDLASYYRLIFGLKQHHHWGVEEIEGMIPWERDIYVDMLVTFLKEQAEKKREQEMNRQYGGR